MIKVDTMGLIAKWNKFVGDYREACRAKDEIHSSVNCPYCSYHYSTSDIRNHEEDTDIDDITAIQCLRCESIFGVETKRNYEPSFSIWREARKIWRNLDFNYNGIK